jgi:hypothetical protein
LTQQLDERQFNGGAITEAQMIQLLRQGTQDLREHNATLAANAGHLGVALAGVIPDGGQQHQAAVPAPRQRYNLHLYGGQFHILPQTWRFPSLGPLAMWLQWWLGDFCQDIPPLKLLQTKDVNHLDFIEIEPGQRRRLAQKILNDLKFLMGYIELKVRDAGLWTENHTAASVVVMYQGVANFFVVRDDAPRHARRDPHLKWQTLVQLIRARVRQERSQ